MQDVRDSRKTKAQLIQELVSLRQRVTELQPLADEPARLVAQLRADNADLVAALTQRSNELTALFRLGHSITANLSLEITLETAYQAVGELMANDAFWIASYQPGTDHYQYLIRIDRGERYPTDTSSIENGCGGYVIRTKQPVILADPANQKLFPHARYGSDDPVKSVLAAPLLIGDRLVGVMATQSYEADAFGQAEQTLLCQLAQPIAIALDNARLYGEMQDKAAELSMANDALHQEIATRKQIQQERESLVAELQDALAQVKTLSGLLPICAHCKSIRDDAGYWSHLETYISEHSEASFTHGICPDCLEKHY